MLGQVSFEAGSWGRAEREELYGLPVLRTRTDPTGWLGDCRLKRAGRALSRQSVTRTLTPPGFDRWALLEEYGLTSVDPSCFVKAQSSALALAFLERQGLAPERATVALRGLRADSMMVRAAAALCPKVRRLVISAPQGGQRLAEWLRWEFGVPILPPEEPGAVALRFHPEGWGEEGRCLTLYGEHPDLDGMRLTAPALSGGDREDLPLLAALWEGGRLGKDALKIT